MSWFKIDDGWWSHPKTLELSNDAIALWVRAGSWSCQHLTDGRIPAFALKSLGGFPRTVNELVKVGYWDSVDDCWVFHDWADYQEHSEVVKNRRNTARERMRTVRTNNKRTFADGSPDGSQEVRTTPTRPDPTRPVLTTSTDVDVAPRKRGTRISEQFIVTAEMREWAATRTPGVDVNSSTEKFVNYWRAKTRDAAKLDWPATWRNWLISDSERTATKPTPEQRARATLSLATDIDMKELGA